MVAKKKINPETASQSEATYRDFDPTLKSVTPAQAGQNVPNAANGWNMPPPQAPPTILEEFYTPVEAAAEIGRSVRTLQRWHALRIGPPRVRVGNLVLYRKSTFIAWLAAQQEEQPLR